MNFDTGGLQPEARAIAHQAAEVYCSHTGPHFVGLLAHGSAFKGGLIPNCSDLDLKLFLTADAFGADGRLPLPLSLAIHADLARIDPAPFHYIQCYAPPPFPSPADKGHSGPLPGTYCMLAGRMPLRETTAAESLQQARAYLDDFKPDPSDLAQKLLQHGGGVLERGVRYLCTEVWPLLYCLLVWRGRDPLTVWSLPKPQAIERWPADEEAGLAIRRFYRCAWRYYVEETTAERALELIESGMAFKRAAMTWYAGQQKD